MIKKLLIFILGTATLTASAQLNSAGTGLIYDNTDPLSNCYLSYGFPGTHAIMDNGTSFEAGDHLLGDGYCTMTSVASIPQWAGAAWYPIPYINGSGCTTAFDADRIDLTNHTEVTIIARSSEIGAKLEFFVGAGGTAWGLGSSTHIGGVIPTLTFTTANADERFVIDLAAVAGNEQEWIDFTGKNDIRAFGWRSASDGVTFGIKRVEIGAESTGAGTGGATCSDGIQNQDETGIDCGGASCSPCGNGGGTGTACTGSVDDHGHGTWYNNLDVQPNGVVKCSFERDDILGTKYGALDKGLLIQNGGTPYCGMCVEATGLEGTAIIQIVDECPDCWDRAGDGSIIVGTNTKFGDIDLSIAAFQAVVDIDHVAAGIGDFDWQEVTCPWQNNLHVITQGSHAWYAKVVIGNHTNRIASVEISNDGGSSYEAMALGVDNGWVKGSFGGDDKTFKITDIYGNEVVLTVNDMDNNGDAKIDGGANFPGCTITSTGDLINSLDFVTTYPNPANTNITFSGLKDVNTIQIVNINGQVVGSKNLSGASAQITFDVSNLASGIYVAKFTNATTTGAVTFVKK